MIQDLNKRLKASRENCKLSRKQVAELVGVSESLIGLYESAARQPSLAVLIKLASLFHVTTDYLLGCETLDNKNLSLSGMSEHQIQALTMTAKCFRNQYIDNSSDSIPQ